MRPVFLDRIERAVRPELFAMRRSLARAAQLVLERGSNPAAVFAPPVVVEALRAQARVGALRRFEREVEVRVNDSDTTGGVPNTLLAAVVPPPADHGRKIMWLEDELLPGATELVARSAAEGEPLVAAGGPARVGDLLRSTVTGEILRVTARSTDSWTVTRHRKPPRWKPGRPEFLRRIDFARPRV